MSLLREATSGGEVVDTSDLATLRHHVGEFLLHRRRLQWPAAPEADQGLRGEVPYLLDNGHAVVQALAAIWGDESWSLDDATAASGWILDHLELGLFPLPLLGPGDPRSDQLIGTHLGGLILAALQVQPGAGSNERQQAYLSWLYGEVVRNSLRSRPEFREPMEELVEQHLVSTEDGRPEERLWLALGGRMLNAMPEPLRIAMCSREALREGFGLPEHGVITVDKYDFDELAFWQAVAGADRNPAPCLKAEGGAKAIVRLQVGEDRCLVVKVDHREFRLDAWAWGVAHDDPAVRRAALAERVDRLDLGEEAMDALADALSGMSPAERVRHVLRQEHAGAAGWYADVRDRIARRTPFNVSELVPENLAAPVKLIRLDDDIEAAAARLIAERGLETTVRRFGALPIEPPRAIAAAIESMADDALTGFLDGVGADGAPPWTQLFIARMMANRPGGAAGLIERVRGWIERGLAPEAVGQWRLYTALARFACSEGPTQLPWRALDARRQLAACWLNAGLLAEIVIAGGVTLDKLVDLVSQNRFVSPRLLLEPIGAFDGDCADPRRASWMRMRAHAAAPALSSLVHEPNSGQWVRRSLRSLAVRGDGGLGDAEIGIAEGGLARSDVLSSHLSADWSALFEDVEPGTGALFGRGLEALVMSVLATECDREQSGSGWPFVRFASGEAALPKELAEEARRVARLPRPLDGRTDWHALQAFTQVAAANGWSDQRDAIGVALEACDPPLLDPTLDPMILIETAVWHAMMEPDLLARTAVLGGHLRRLARHEELRTPCEEAARHFAKGLPGQYAEAFVDVLAEIWATR